MRLPRTYTLNEVYQHFANIYTEEKLKNLQIILNEAKTLEDACKVALFAGFVNGIVFSGDIVKEIDSLNQKENDAC